VEGLPLSQRAAPRLPAEIVEIATQRPIGIRRGNQGWCAHRLLAILLAEHQEDMARLGGFPGTADPARSASEESVLRRLWHRLPLPPLGERPV
jgi:hypothetical protein